MLKDLNDRTRQILKLVVDAYVETGEPVGSVAISQRLGMRLSPATIRNTMADLEELGLLYAPHTSAGRMPTETGLTVFVEGLLELDPLPAAEKEKIDRRIRPDGGNTPRDMLENAGDLLSGLSSCAGLVFAPKHDDVLKQVDFILLSPGKALAVLVTASGTVENRILDVGSDVTATTLTRAANYINARISEKSLGQAAEHIRNELARDRNLLDVLTASVVERGIASLSPVGSGAHFLIKGQANLLDDVTALQDLERIRSLMEALDAKESMLNLLQATTIADGVKIFIGAENALFRHAGCTMIVAPYKTQDARMVGALGVIGPARMNYSRIIPVINYTSHVIGKLMSSQAGSV